MVDSITIQLDELSLEKEKSITKTFEPDERILISIHVSKFNRKNKRQERSLMITNKSIYNLSKMNIKRKIAVSKVQGITYGTSCNEFVLHIPDEYDYRYASVKKDIILYHLIKAYCMGKKEQFLQFYSRDDITLEKYTTTKPDRKKGINKMPTENPSYMNEDIFLKNYGQNIAKASGLETQHASPIREKTHTLFAKKKGEEIGLESFNLLKVLGRGAFGKVMLVEKKDTKEIFAMKSMRKEELIDKEQIQHTKTEKEIMEHVNHPFLVNLAYAFQTPDKIFFVMQFMRGGELFQHLRHSKKFEESRAKFYASQILMALGHLHEKDIVYRDLKPENILMDDFGNVCLTDFGMAKVIRSNEVSMSFCGTPEYLAPEIVTNEGHTKAADWWSLGILIYEMMYGIPPFYNKNQSQMFQLIKDSEVRFPQNPATSTEAKDIITKLLVKDQTKRLGTKGDFPEIKGHPWFGDIDFDKLLKKEIQPPFKPKITGDNWVQNFDEEFTREEAINSYVPGTNMNLINEYQDEFRGFEFAKK